ncbi:patatin-like phospholipase family protein [Amnibacterium sp. CER49]|uniref:patatin-like phospholipase family protein n=1 Tax=Amnibacterium sp. CER49 TaxID=3039161 RepID=UPI002446D877|nr:patatin-like phospholipase family protein [Amnibacterium sp. CER49]MDH2443930.1 patatin-like phospholipase family protein [Amnibacterium sp. CER49]
MPGTALVLGGGGIAGIAWETGVLVGLAEAGVDLAAADVVVGTSAGSVAGCLLRSGRSAASYAAVVAEGEQEDREHPPVEIPDVEGFRAAMAEALSGPIGSEQEARARVGALALQLDASHQREQVAVFEELVGGDYWPEGDLRITAVDADTGAFRAFDRGSGADLATAVAASCAVPLVYPVVELAGRRWMDGGMRSATNADLVEGAERVVVLACNPEPPVSPLGPSLPQALERLRRTARVVLIEPDAGSRAAFGTNSLAHSVRVPCAVAGHAQGLAEAERVRAVWG